MKKFGVTWKTLTIYLKASKTWSNNYLNGKQHSTSAYVCLECFCFVSDSKSYARPNTHQRNVQLVRWIYLTFWIRNVNGFTVSIIHLHTWVTAGSIEKCSDKNNHKKSLKKSQSSSACFVNMYFRWNMQKKYRFCQFKWNLTKVSVFCE